MIHHIAVAVFDRQAGLKWWNNEFEAMVGFSPNKGCDERYCLNSMRVQGKLPNEPDYWNWLELMMGSYQIEGITKYLPWYCNNGVQIIRTVVPASMDVTCIYEISNWYSFTSTRG